MLICVTTQFHPNIYTRKHTLTDTQPQKAEQQSRRVNEFKAFLSFVLFRRNMKILINFNLLKHAFRFQE